MTSPHLQQELTRAIQSLNVKRMTSALDRGADPRQGLPFSGGAADETMRSDGNAIDVLLCGGLHEVIAYTADQDTRNKHLTAAMVMIQALGPHHVPVDPGRARAAVLVCVDMVRPSDVERMAPAYVSLVRWAHANGVNWDEKPVGCLLSHTKTARQRMEAMAPGLLAQAGVESIREPDAAVEKRHRRAIH